METEILVLTFLITNTIFWSFFPHKAHCDFVNYINKILSLNVKCPDHSIHLFIGLLFYILSVYYAQRDVPEFKKLMTRYFR